MHTSDFDFTLPDELIAQAPAARRDGSRLLHLRRPSGLVAHRRFVEIPELLRRGDLLVFNDARVIPARLLGKKAGTGGKVELLLVRPAGEQRTPSALEADAAGVAWQCLGQASKGIKAGAALEFEGGLTATIEAALGGGEYRVRFTSPMATLREAIERAGRLPLPPYIARAPTGDDAERYQTIFARAQGSVAAPTAGLHFTPQTFARLGDAGVERAFVTLDVGPGTFLPVRDGEVSAHHMHAERYAVPAETARAIAAAKAEGRRVIAVGTTVVRTLESAAGAAWSGEMQGPFGPGEVEALRGGLSTPLGVSGGTRSAGGPLDSARGERGGFPASDSSGDTTLFITPGFAFKAVDAMVTNFHLPKSTLLMLVSAFAGREQTLAAYAEAVRERYRFFSYGDAMFIEGDR